MIESLVSPVSPIRSIGCRVPPRPSHRCRVSPRRDASLGETGLRKSNVAWDQSSERIVLFENISTAQDQARKLQASIHVFAIGNVTTCLLGLFLLVGCSQNTPERSSGEALTQRVQKGAVELSIRVSPKEPRLSDLVELEVSVQYPPDIQIEPPVFGQSVGDFAVREYGERTVATSASKSVDRNPQDNALESRVFRYQLEPMFSGKHLIRTIPIVFQSTTRGESSRDVVQTEPIELNVRSEIGDSAPDLASIDPMLGPIGLSRTSWIAWTLGIGGVATLIAGAWLLLNRKNKQKDAPVVLSPADSARLALDRLVAEELPRHGKVKEFYLRLTGIVRQYIEGTTGVRAPEQTTEEFLREMRQSQRFDGSHSVRLQEFLEAADMVKYAGQQPDEGHIANSLDRAREFITTQFVDTSTEDSAVLLSPEGKV